MKTLLKAMRSIFTSFLFLILVVAIFLQFILTSARKNGDIEDFINTEQVVQSVIGKEIDIEINEILESYVHDYLSYIFHRRSYPSIQSLDLKSFDENVQKEIQMHIEDIQEKIDLKYETITKLRDLAGYLSNGAIYLLVNILIIILFVVLAVIREDLLETVRLFSLSISIGGVVSLIFSYIFITNFKSLVGSSLYILFKDSLAHLKSDLLERSLIYIAIGVLMFVISYLITKLCIKKKK